MKRIAIGCTMTNQAKQSAKIKIADMVPIPLRKWERIVPPHAFGITRVDALPLKSNLSRCRQITYAPPPLYRHRPPHHVSMAVANTSITPKLERNASGFMEKIHPMPIHASRRIVEQRSTH